VLLAALLVAGAVAIVASATIGSERHGRQAAALGTHLDRMENVLDQSAAGRREIGDALTATSSVRSRSQEHAGPARRRSRQSSPAPGSLSTPTSETAALVTLLQGALQDSIEADRHYRDGFRGIGVGATCPLPSTRDFELAARADAAATAAKVRFAKDFNVLAERYGRSPWSPEGF
jgi:hypothetical protein